MIQSTLEEVKKTMSDSESDSGVGSVRTNDQSSENDSAGEQKKTVTLITPKPTNKTGKLKPRIHLKITLVLNKMF